MTDPDSTPERRRFNVGVHKQPYGDRRLMRQWLPDDGSAVERGFLDIIGAATPDDDQRFPVGARTTYSMLLTDDEAAELAERPTVRFVSPDQELHRHGPGRV